MTKQPPQAHQSPNLVPNKLDTFDENFGHEESLQACAEDSIEGEHHQEVKLLDPESDEQTNSSTQSATISCSDKLRRTSRSAYGRQSSSDSCPNAFSLATLPDECYFLPMMRSSTIASLAALASLTAAQTYTLEDDYTPSSFFNMFDFFTGADPTNGYVTYVDQGTAQSSGLINASSSVYIGVDYTNVATGSGRGSVRLVSQKSYNHGLIILDLEHMPGGICGTWPAFWTLGPDWPDNGEIDIIEGVNSQTANDMTLHTDAGCSIASTGFTGTLETSNCDVNAPNQATNAGCSIDAQSSQTYGAGFNANGGGVYATEWTRDAISIFFFPRGSIPSDISSGHPNPSGWGTPMASFAGSCDIDQHVLNQQIVFDTTFCGDWAGAVWTTDAVCAPLPSTCQAYVQNTPSAFTNAYWSVNSLSVYTTSGGAAPSSASASSSTAASTSTTSAIATTTSISSTTLATTTTTALPSTTLATNILTSTTLPTTTFIPGSTTTSVTSTTTETSSTSSSSSSSSSSSTPFSPSTRFFTTNPFTTHTPPTSTSTSTSYTTPSTSYTTSLTSPSSYTFSYTTPPTVPSSYSYSTSGTWSPTGSQGSWTDSSWTAAPTDSSWSSWSAQTQGGGWAGQTGGDWNLSRADHPQRRSRRGAMGA